MGSLCLNAPTGAWCSLTPSGGVSRPSGVSSQCTYRCVVLPDAGLDPVEGDEVVSQCTYRCVVLPDKSEGTTMNLILPVSMHLQVRGAP